MATKKKVSYFYDGKRDTPALIPADNSIIINSSSSNRVPVS